MGKLGMVGLLPPSILVLFSYEGYPGVEGSPGYSDKNCTEPRCTEVGLRAGPWG